MRVLDSELPGLNLGLYCTLTWSRCDLGQVPERTASEIFVSWSAVQEQPRVHTPSLKPLEPAVVLDSEFFSV